MTNGALCSSHLDEIPAERCQLANTITLCEPNTKHQLYIPSYVNIWPMFWHTYNVLYLILTQKVHFKAKIDSFFIFM